MTEIFVVYKKKFPKLGCSMYLCNFFRFQNFSNYSFLLSIRELIQVSGNQMARKESAGQKLLLVILLEDK